MNLPPFVWLYMIKGECYINSQLLTSICLDSVKTKRLQQDGAGHAYYEYNGTWWQDINKIIVGSWLLL